MTHAGTQIVAREKCKSCLKAVSMKARIVICHFCSAKVHTKCDKTLPSQAVALLNNDNIPGVCYICSECRPVTKSKPQAADPDVDKCESKLETRIIDLESSLKRVECTLISFTNQHATTGLVDGDDAISSERKPLARGLLKEQPCITNREHAVVSGSFDAGTRLEDRPDGRGMLSLNTAQSSRSYAAAVSGNQSDQAAVDGVRSLPNSKPKPSNREQPNPDIPLTLKLHALSVICTNLPESKETLFENRRHCDIQAWIKLCENIHLSPITPTSTTRLTRHPSSPHTDKPRLLRVTFKSEADLENVLLHSHFLLEFPESTCRIFPDIPWWERKWVPNGRDQAASRKLVLLGVPEMEGTPSVHERSKHDHKQWRFLADAIDDQEAVVVGTFRLPRSPNYKGEGPNPLQLTFLTTNMADTIKTKWNSRRHNLPNGLILIPPRSKQRNQMDHRSFTQLPNVNLQEAITVNPSKNERGPTHSESDQ